MPPGGIGGKEKVSGERYFSEEKRIIEKNENNPKYDTIR